MTFLKHESCPQCGSRDNLARYKDGGAWCFGCGYYERGNVNPLVQRRNNEQDQSDDNEYGRKPSLPRDASQSYPAHIKKYLGKFSIQEQEAKEARIFYSPSRDQLIFTFYDASGDLCCTQARNFNPEWASKAKYYNEGQKSESFTIFDTRKRLAGNGSTAFDENKETTTGSNSGGQPSGSFLGNNNCLVLCEDALSSLKVARTSPSMPLLGTHIAKEKLMALKGSYDSLIVWLDSDKFKEAVFISDTAKLIGFKARAVFTELDPKELSDETIRKIVLDKE
ncbi:MAG: hypothetical protein KGI54_10595 [Pseudomonadota bacterium]|nr:hypothetical protein [Pseudomonadota bacterium]